MLRLKKIVPKESISDHSSSYSLQRSMTNSVQRLDDSVLCKHLPRQPDNWGSLTATKYFVFFILGLLLIS